MNKNIEIENSRKPVVLITGCASGIGLELAKLLFDQSEYRVVITSRAHHLEALKSRFPDSRRCMVRELDVTDNTCLYHLVHEICRVWGRIDCVVNNAAVCFRAVVEHMDTDSEDLQLRTNYLGPMTLARAVLPIMREQGGGQVINVSSASGILAMPTMASYSASKHALKGATEALWYEAKPFGISINLIELGFVKSDSFRNVVLSKKAQMSVSLNGPHAEYYRSMVPFVEKLMNLSWTDSTTVAKKILATIKHRPSRLRIAATPDVILFNLMQRVLPSSTLNLLLYAMLPESRRWGRHRKVALLSS